MEPALRHPPQRETNLCKSFAIGGRTSDCGKGAVSVSGLWGLSAERVNKSEGQTLLRGTQSRDASSQQHTHSKSFLALVCQLIGTSLAPGLGERHEKDTQGAPPSGCMFSVYLAGYRTKDPESLGHCHTSSSVGK